jgi:hypothetical protein
VRPDFKQARREITDCLANVEPLFHQRDIRVLRDAFSWQPAEP